MNKPSPKTIKKTDEEKTELRKKRKVMEKEMENKGIFKYLKGEKK